MVRQINLPKNEEDWELHWRPCEMYSYYFVTNRFYWNKESISMSITISLLMWSFWSLLYINIFIMCYNSLSNWTNIPPRQHSGRAFAPSAESKKYRYQAIKQKEQSKLKIQKTKLSHELRRHKWQCEIWWSRRVSISCSACGIRHDIPYVVSRNETYSWQKYHGLQMSLEMVVTETR